MTALDAKKQVQALVCTPQDGKNGLKTRAAFEALFTMPDDAEWPPVADSTVHHVMASSFADPADVAAFRRAKARGLSDQEAFKVGDNGIGKWGDDTTGRVPMCALPPEKWQQFGSAARGKKVFVVCEGKQVMCELGDTMPHEENIKNGAGLDLNPAAWKALGHAPPQMRPATWQWA